MTGMTDAVVDRTFADIISRDDDLVRTEFDAIVAASWPPPPPPPAVPRPADRPPWWPSARAAQWAPASTPAVPHRWRSRQRSPPGHRPEPDAEGR